MTPTANAEMAVLHERMPVILEQADWLGWLGETEVQPATLLRPSRLKPRRPCPVWTSSAPSVMANWVSHPCGRG